jgi:hypothetical protein
MLKTFLRKALLHVGGLLLILAVAYGFREGLTRVAANFLLADSGLTLTHLQGLQLGTHRAAVDTLTFGMTSGLQITLTDVAVEYRVVSLTSAPIVETLQIGSAWVLRNSSNQDSSAQDDTSGEPLLLSDVLQLAREFPLASVVVGDFVAGEFVVSELDVPQHSEALAVTMQHRSGDLSLRVDSGSLQLLARFTQADAAAVADLQVTLTRGAGMVGDFHLLLQPTGSNFGLNGSGHLQFDDLNTLLGELQQQPLALPLKAARLDWSLAGSVADDVRGTFQSSANASTPASFVLGLQSGSTFTLPAELASGLGELVVAFNDNAELIVVTGADPRISGGRVPLQVAGSWRQQAVNIDSVLTFADCGVADCSLAFNGNAAVADYTLAGAIAVAATDVAAGVGKFGIKTTDLQLGGLPGWTPLFDIDATVVREQNQLSLSTPLLLRNAPADAGITASGNYDLASGTANAKLTVPRIEFTDSGRALSAWLSGWPYGFDLLTGTLTAEVDLQWQPAVASSAGVLHANMTANLQDVAGFYGDYFFGGLSGDLQGSADVADMITMETPPLALTIASLDVGVPIDNVALDFRFDRTSDQLLISSLSTDMLGGTVSGKDLAYDFSRERNELTLRFAGLQLERMLALADYDGVAAIGGVSGELPLTLSATGVEVTAGTLQSDAPGGSIRYLAGAAAIAQGNAGLDLVNQALGNYQFTSLSSNIDYSADGELLLSMQLQGYSPDVGVDQPINLNLTLTDNIPALLKSLQSARAIEDFLQKQNP